MLLKRERHGKL
jgi:hypothetical protein